MAGALGLWGYRFARHGREAARENLARITGLRDAMLDELCRENFAQFMRMMADYFYCTAAPPVEIRALVDTWEGFEQITAARKLGKGGILITAHLGNWELGGIILALAGVPLTVITLQEPTSELTEWREAYRQRLGIRTIAIGSDPFSFVGIVSALRRNEFVAMLVDRPYGDAAVPVRFFGADRAILLRAQPAARAHRGRRDPRICFTKAGGQIRFRARETDTDDLGQLLQRATNGYGI